MKREKNGNEAPKGRLMRNSLIVITVMFLAILSTAPGVSAGSNDATATEGLETNQTDGTSPIREDRERGFIPPTKGQAAPELTFPGLDEFENQRALEKLAEYDKVEAASMVEADQAYVALDSTKALPLDPQGVTVQGGEGTAPDFEAGASTLAASSNKIS